MTAHTQTLIAHASGQIEHLNEGSCAGPESPDARDDRCPVCIALLALEVDEAAMGRAQPSDADLIALAQETKSADPGRDGYVLPVAFARAVLARYGAGRPASPVSAEPVEMGIGKVAIGSCTRSTDGAPGVIYLNLPEPRELNADCTDVFPIGSAPPEGSIGACIYFLTPESLQQSIDVLIELQAAHYPKAAPVAAQASVPEGWKLVPIRPTPEMIEAADAVDLEYSFRYHGNSNGPALQRSGEDHWDVMVAASPAAPERAESAAVTDGERKAMLALIEVATQSFYVADDAEDEGSEGIKVPKDEMAKLNAALDKLEELPDDQLGYVLGPSSKAEWALRRLLKSAGSLADGQEK